MFLSCCNFTNTRNTKTEVVSQTKVKLQCVTSLTRNPKVLRLHPNHEVTGEKFDLPTHLSIGSGQLVQCCRCRDRMLTLVSEPEILSESEVLTQTTDGLRTARV
jgi:hypothetical protein